VTGKLRGGGGHPWTMQGTGAGGRSTGPVESPGRDGYMVSGDTGGDWVWQGVEGGTGVA